MNEEMFIRRLFETARAGGITECEAYIASGESFDVDVLDGAIKEYNVSASGGLCFRGVYAGRMGYASTEIMDDDAVEMLVNGVKENALLLETAENESIYAGDGGYPAMDYMDKDTLSLSAKQKIDMSLELEKKAKALDKRITRVEGCGVASHVSRTRIVNSLGLDVSFSRASVSAGVVPIAGENGRSNYGYAYKNVYSPARIDLDELAEKAAKEAVTGLTGESIPSGTYRCVLRSDVAGQFLRTFSGVFSGESARKGISLLRGREGETIASSVITLTDDPLLKNGPASKPFDCEGVRTQTKNVIEAGVLKTLLHNRKTAQALGCQTTGNASKAGYAGRVDVSPSNFYIQPSDKSFDALLAQVGDGLVITSVMGLHSGANGISGDFSLGAKGYLIENGKKGRAVEQITVAGNFFDMLKNTVVVADDLDFESSGAVCSPSLYIGDIKVAGK